MQVNPMKLFAAWSEKYARRELISLGNCASSNGQSESQKLKSGRSSKLVMRSFSRPSMIGFGEPKLRRFQRPSPRISMTLRKPALSGCLVGLTRNGSEQKRKNPIF
jgi:hypothetical protein